MPIPWPRCGAAARAHMHTLVSTSKRNASASKTAFGWRRKVGFAATVQPAKSTGSAQKVIIKNGHYTRPQGEKEKFKNS